MSPTVTAIADHVERHTPARSPYSRDRLDASDGKQTKKRQPRRLAETLQSLEVYVALIVGHGPQTVRQLMDATSIPDGTLYPALQKRVAAGLLAANERDGIAVFELTGTGYEHAREVLHRLYIDPATWLRADKTYTAPK